MRLYIDFSLEVVAWTHVGVNVALDAGFSQQPRASVVKIRLSHAQLGKYQF